MLYIGVTNQYYVEFGTQDANERCTRVLAQKGPPIITTSLSLSLSLVCGMYVFIYVCMCVGWSGLLMDGEHEDLSINLHQEFITVDNFISLLEK